MRKIFQTHILKILKVPRVDFFMASIVKGNVLIFVFPTEKSCQIIVVFGCNSQSFLNKKTLNYILISLLYTIILASPSIATHLKYLLVFIYKSIINVNLYKTTSTDEIDLRQQRIHTKIYLILFISCLSVLLFYTAIIERSITKTQTMPSIDDYKYLMDVYADNLNCPCTRISIPYNEFVTELRVSAFHQACTTKLIQNALAAGNHTQFHLNFQPSRTDYNYFYWVFISTTYKCFVKRIAKSLSTKVSIFFVKFVSCAKCYCQKCIFRAILINRTSSSNRTSVRESLSVAKKSSFE